MKAQRPRFISVKRHRRRNKKGKTYTVRPHSRKVYRHLIGVKGYKRKNKSGKVSKVTRHQKYVYRGKNYERKR